MSHKPEYTTTWLAAYESYNEYFNTNFVCYLWVSVAVDNRLSHKVINSRETCLLDSVTQADFSNTNTYTLLSYFISTVIVIYDLVRKSGACKN